MLKKNDLPSVADDFEQPQPADPVAYRERAKQVGAETMESVGAPVSVYFACASMQPPSDGWQWFGHETSVVKEMLANMAADVAALKPTQGVN